MPPTDSKGDKGGLDLLTYLKHLRVRAEELKAKRINVEMSVEDLQSLIDAVEAVS